MIDRKTIGLLIKNRREILGWSQDDLADKFGMQQTAISNYERGERGIEANELARLADLLGVEMTYFFPSRDINADEQEMLIFYRGVPSSDRPKAKRILQAMREEDNESDDLPTFGRGKGAK